MPMFQQCCYELGIIDEYYDAHTNLSNQYFILNYDISSTKIDYSNFAEDLYDGI